MGAMDEEQLFESALERAASAMGIATTAEARDVMRRHYARLVEANRQFNLTRITSPEDAAVKHYADSLTLLALPGMDSAPRRVVDVGTGAGFPAVPLAICRGEWSILAIDGTNKKVQFVAACAEALGLSNLAARHLRGAELAREQAGAFDLVVLRAVTQLAPGLREVAPLLAPSGRIVFYKTAAMEPAERRDGEKMAARLGLTPHEYPLELPAGNETLHRLLIVFERSDKRS